MAEKIDYGNVPITKLPPGKAYGADDLHRWSVNRSVGRSGSGESGIKVAVMKCPKCKEVTEIIVPKSVHRKRIGQMCRHCGKPGVKFLKFKRG